MYVRQMYPSQKLYQVTSDYTAAQMMDISLPRGTVVGIIKESDPMGNKDRWFVDNGGETMGVLSGFRDSYGYWPF